MAAINADLPTLADIAKRMDPNGAIASIIESLQQRNEIMQDMVWKEGNLPTGHQFTSRTALPSVTWRRFNEGVTPSKSRTDQVIETCGMMSALSPVDVQLAKLNGNEAAFRASEDKAHLMAFDNELETGIVYHSTKTAPEKIMGFAPRLDVTSGNNASSQIIKHTGSPSGADQTSIWGVCWSPETVYGIFPKGTVAGMQQQDLGIQLWNDANSKKFRAYVTSYDWQVGVCVADWRYLVRICNIDTSALSATNDDLIPAMIDAYYQIHNPKLGRMAWYCNRKIHAFLQKQARTAVKNSTLDISEIAGKPIVTFMGDPVRMSDAILNTESAVS